MSVEGSYSRTRNSIKNSIVAVSLQILSLLVGFWSRKIFLNYLGTEILGLNTTASSLMEFLNLTELGIGSAIAVTLYKPIFDNDRQSIKEIVALQGWFYRIIAFIVMAGSAVLMCFFPLIFDKTPLPLWYAYASFGVFLYSSLTTYFISYKQVLLDAYQMNYKIQLTTKLINIIKFIVQAFAIKHFDNCFLWWLGLEFAFSTLNAVLLSIKANRTFPFIREKVDNPSGLRYKYPVVTSKIKQLFVHKIGDFTIRQCTPLVIYAFASLTLVAKYSNYLIFTNNLGFILSAFFIGLTASVGNMVASGDKALTTKVFRELYSTRFLMTAVCCICLWILVEPFVCLWIGEEYVLDSTTLLLLIVLFYINNSRNVVDSYLYAYGLFKDVWSPIACAVLSLGLSIILGSAYGLNGILMGFIIGEFLIIKIWKPFFLFRNGLKISFLYYVGITLKHVASAAVSFAAVLSLKSLINIDPWASFGTFFIYALIIFCAASVILFAILFASEKGMRGFVRRMLNITKDILD